MNEARRRKSHPCGQLRSRRNCRSRLKAALYAVIASPTSELGRRRLYFLSLILVSLFFPPFNSSIPLGKHRACQSTRTQICGQTDSAKRRPEFQSESTFRRFEG